MFNAFAHMGELVWTNIDGAYIFGVPHRDVVSLPDGQMIPSATEGQPETLTFWLQSSGTHQQLSPDQAFHQITAEQAFTQNLWLHYTYGAPFAGWAKVVGLGDNFHVTDAALLAAIDTLPNATAALAHFSDSDILAYAHDAAPLVMIVGSVPDQPPSA